MTPLYDLNQPSSSFQLAEDQHLQLFLSPHHHAAAASTFFNTTDQDQTKLIGESSPHHDHKVDKYISRSDHIIPLYSSSSSSSSSSLQAAVNGNFEVHKCKRDQDEDYYDDGSEKWMPSKMRIMQKMINSDQSKSNDRPLKFTLKFQDHQANNNDIINSSSTNINININNNTIRVCSDCNTTTTPLWRSGPRGPKSLCNACGIRQRKARRAMAVATTAMGNGTMDQTSSTKAKVKEKKSRTSHVPQCKKLCKPPPPHHNHTQNTKITFKNLALTLSNNSTLQRVFPQDVEQAAILLMELSCGFIHS